MSSLLEQAIIDAKALKDAAEKNAQNKVLEQYSAQIKEAVDSILDQDEEEDLLDQEEEMEAAEAEENPLTDKIPSALSADDEEIEIDLDQLSDLVGDEMGKEEEINDVGDVGEAIGDLKDTVKDLKDTVEDIKAMAPESEPQEELPDNQISEEEEKEEDSDDEMISAIGQISKSQTIEKEDGDTKVSVDMGDENPEPHQWARNVANREEDAERRKVIFSLKEKNNKLNQKNTNLSQKNSKLTEELSKYKEAMKTVIKKIEEVNLLNARLLYKNQALGSDSLNERQKTNIVGAISKAKTVNEAKLIYETLQNANVDGRIKKGPKSLHEVCSKKGSPFVKREKESSGEESAEANRFKKLAGLD